MVVSVLETAAEESSATGGESAASRDLKCSRTARTSEGVHKTKKAQGFGLPRIDGELTTKGQLSVEIH